jgi:hypothetical protein
MLDRVAANRPRSAATDDCGQECATRHTFFWRRSRLQRWLLDRLAANPQRRATARVCY